MSKITGREQFKELRKYIKRGKAVEGEDVLLCYEAERKRKLRGMKAAPHWRDEFKARVRNLKSNAGKESD